MHPSEFQRILNQGLGRAIIHLQQYDASPYQEVILNACLHNTAYDPQIEGTRAPYLHEVIKLTGNEAYYRDHILAALAAAEPSEDWDYLLLMFLTLNIANDGYQPARDALYGCFERDIAANFTDIAFALLSLDGLAALTLIARHPDAEWEYRSLAIEIEEYPREDIVAATAASPAFQTALIAALNVINNRKPIDREAFLEERRREVAIPYEELKRYLTKGDDFRRFGTYRFLQGWGQYASNDDLRLAAQDLIAEQDEKRLQQYIDIFSKRPFPLDPDKLIMVVRQQMPVTRHEHGRYSEGSMLVLRTKCALAQVQHPEVRKLALDLLKSDEPNWGADLLLNNFEQGDWSLINAAVTTPNLAPMIFHGLGLAVKTLLLKHSSPDAAPSLIALYEHIPCSACRERIVLVRLGLLPSYIHEECKFDSNQDLRMLARHGFMELQDE